jgi:peptidoglycan/LPS O-acetylase OafA/YrhL
MGVLRVFLAIMIVVLHTAPAYAQGFPFPIIFVISGFYMGLILTEKYTGPGRYRLFITNRLLRLMPPYWIFLLFSLLLSLFYLAFMGSSLLLGPWLTSFGKLSPAAILTLITANLTIYGQDLLFFVYLNPATDALTFAADALRQPIPAWFFLLIPQAWFMSLELLFYLLAPWLTRRGNLLLGVLVAASLGFRLVILQSNLPLDPWIVRLFPAVLLYFIIGLWSYRLYARLKVMTLPTWLPWIVTALYFAFLAVYMLLPGEALRQIGIFAASLVAIPFVFILTKRMRFDRMVAEMSYPIYITHWTFMYVVRYHFGSNHLFLTTISATVLFSVLYIWLVTNPLEHFRQKRTVTARLQRAA